MRHSYLKEQKRLKTALSFTLRHSMPTFTISVPNFIYYTISFLDM